ncbi:MAG: response regulator transcription factor [Geminicoccaceae bacterium]
MRLLFIEDNARLAANTAASLRDAGFVVDLAETGEDGLLALDATRYDALILDLGLPDMDGMAVLSTLRDRSPDLPVLILTARDALDDRINGLNAGSDDYLVKPFAAGELVARIKALLRRPGGALGTVLEAGNLSFDTVGRETRIGNGAAPLSKRESDVLELLLRRKGRVVPKDAIEESLYGFDEEATPNAVEVATHRLRKKLESAGATVRIHTLRGVGYLLEDSDP